MNTANPHARPKTPRPFPALIAPIIGATAGIALAVFLIRWNLARQETKAAERAATEAAIPDAPPTVQFSPEIHSRIAHDEREQDQEVEKIRDRVRTGIFRFDGASLSIPFPHWDNLDAIHRRRLKINATLFAGKPCTLRDMATGAELIPPPALLNSP